jgi:hypothetical protein
MRLSNFNFLFLSGNTTKVVFFHGKRKSGKMKKQREISRSCSFAGRAHEAKMLILRWF